MIKKNSEQIKEFSSTFQTEMKSYCDIVKKNCEKSVVSPEKQKNVIKLEAEEEDRKSNLIVFGQTEDTNDDLTNAVSELFEAVCAKSKVIEFSRMGGKRQEHRRPMKVKSNSQDNINTVLRNNRKLKGVVKFEAGFIAPDRSIEHRAIQLVWRRWKKIKTEPS